MNFSDEIKNLVFLEKYKQPRRGMKDMKITLPSKVNQIIHTIRSANFDAYAVGGCIRDSVLGRMPNDWDITTSAKPEEIKSLFPKTIDTGIRHGTVTVMLQKEGFEVTTYRIDGEYEDSRHPKEVTFTASLEEDLKRRDFTINAMAYNEEEGLIDIFGGMEDIERKVIRCVGEAAERFSEDALRMMRAVRFSAQLGYTIEEKTETAIRKLAPTLQKISAERIQAELVKLVTSPNPDYLRIAYETGVTKEVLPEFDRMMQTDQNNPHHCYCVGEHTLQAMKQIKPDKVLRLAMLFHDIAKPDMLTVDEEGIYHFHGHPEEGAVMTKEIMKRLKFDNDTIGKVTTLVRFHDYHIAQTPQGMRRAINKIGEDIMPYLFLVKQADMLAQSSYQREGKQKDLDRLQEIYKEVLAKKDCVCLKNLAVTGNDLIASGMKPGKEIGEILDRLLQLVIEEPACNEKEYLLKKAEEIRSLN